MPGEGRLRRHALIYAAAPGHPLGRRVLSLFRASGPGTAAGTGSVLLLPEVLGKPLRDGSAAEIRALAGLLARLDLRPVDRATAELAPRWRAGTGCGRRTRRTWPPPGLARGPAWSRRGSGVAEYEIELTAARAQAA